MKKLIIVLLLIISVMPTVMACGENNNQDEGGVKMTATILEIERKYILVEADDENAFGEYQVNIDDSITKYYDAQNNIIAKKDLKVGDKIEIIYNGQVARSLPPQIFGLEIKLK